MSQVRRTRIVCTIGPSSSSPHTLRAMIQAGMDVARLNFSHGDPDAHREAAANVREAADAVGRPVALLGDLQGPKIRTGPVEGTFQRLVRGRAVALVARHTETPDDIEVSHVELVQALRVGDRVLLDDGRIELAVRAVEDGRADASVVRGGLLGERKGISVPGRALPLPAMTEKDVDDLKLAVDLEVDYIALSFVRRPEDVLICQQHITGHNRDIPVIAKLEKLEAIRNLSKILEVADAVMVARGDLGVELKLGELPAVQKEVIDRANRAGVPVITATEMLESMVTSNRPTRAEASDVANAIWDGTDAVMLSQETSIGAHPIEAVRAMARICLAAEKHPDFERAHQIWHEARCRRCHRPRRRLNRDRARGQGHHRLYGVRHHGPALQQGPTADARGRRQPSRGGTAPDRPVLRRRPAPRQARQRHRPDDLERDGSRPGRGHGPHGRPGGGRGGRPRGAARPDQPAQGGDRLRPLKEA